jgi:hypothetical protein
MGWDRSHRYYTRSRKVRGRVIREYVGGGFIGELAAVADDRARAERAAKASEWREEKARLATLDAQLDALETQTRFIADAALQAAGFHQHKRQWRRKRAGLPEPTPSGGSGGGR